MSATPDSMLANPEQRIADLELQLAESEAELAKALERETATAEVLQVINSSPGDLAPVFDAMLEKAMRLCETAFGHLMTWDGERFHRIAFRGMPEDLIEEMRQPMKPVPGSFLDQVVQGKELICHADLQEAEAGSVGPGAASLMRFGARARAMVALRKDERLLGTITVYRTEVRPFTDKQIALLQNFAAQAVIAMENARLITETREALDQQTATAEVLQVINSSPGDLTPVFDAILEKAHTLCSADIGSLVSFDGEHLHALATRGMPAAFDDFVREPFLPDSNSFEERLIRDQRLIHIPDVQALGPLPENPITRAAIRLGGIRTVLFVPLQKDAEAGGYIAAARAQVRPFSDKEIALLQNFAAQAVIAMENARLLTETREALEQQTATAEVLQVINSSPGDLAPVFDAMLDKAMRLCEAAFGVLRTYDGERLNAVAMHGVPDEYTDFAREPLLPSPQTGLGRILHGENLVHIADIRDDEVYRSGDRLRVATVELGGARTLLVVPLRKEGALLGVFTIYRQEIRPFSDKQIALVENFAAQAVIAMENARLITETREALEQQTATAEVLGVINSSPDDLAPVFDAMLEKALRLCDAAVGHLMTYDGTKVHLGASCGISTEAAEAIRAWVPEPESAPGKLVQGADIVQIADAADTEAYRSGVPSRVWLVDLIGARTALWVSLRKDGTLLGVLVVYRREVRLFTDKQIALLQNFAAQAVIAMENARLLGELHQRTDEVAELNRGLEARVAEQVEELGRVGRLKRFLAPQLAELIVSQGDEKILESHRREIVVVFCDLRGYTAFTETAEPEEVLEFLRQYHGALGPLVSQFEGTLDQFSGDGIMVFFNDPVPCPDPAERAVKMAMAMREEAGKLIAAWRLHGCELGFGAGIAQGFATLGQIGFSERSGYTAIGTVCNLAARLCAEAKDGQILVSSYIAEAVKAVARLEDLGNLELKGLRRPVAAFNVMQSSSAADARPSLTVVARGPEV